MEQHEGIDEYLDPEWDKDLEGSSYVKFPAVVEFRSNVPLRCKNRFGKDVWRWDVIQFDQEGHEIGPKMVSTASKRLRRCLSALKPLMGKRLFIKRLGEGMDTEYSVETLRRGNNKELV